MKKHEPVAIVFGQVVQEQREKLNMSKQELADKAEVDVRTISRVEAGESGVGLYSVFTIAAALGLKVSELIYIAEEA